MGVQKPGPQYSPVIYTMDIAYKIDIPLYIFDRIYYNKYEVDPINII